MNEEYKKQVYKRWKENGELWFSKNPSKDPTYEECKIIIEMKKKEAGVKSEFDQDIEKRTKDIRERYGKKCKISDKIFDKVFDY